ncbi:Trigger factor [Austwickia sp. TVS 96-490-7B]|uniref:trigger factor n=1 Tax=Austwickia sp. TVS 96-490-7B TaxID=2830843 RepID=UPI001C574889|nr:trigger factor [Austwickia sp. TVS 96-490-7B]MBW3086519.1 Trigger factor [Austwickia sp. TVS 96-490-7B]
MKSAVETLNPTRVKLTIEVPYEELKPSVDAALKAISSQISVPGFRPGKVPARIVEQRVGKGAVLQEAVNEALPGLYGKAVDEAGLKPLGQPEVDIVEIPLEDGQQFVFTAEVDVRPEITLPDYSALKVEVDTVDEESIDKDAEQRLTLLRQRFGSLNTVERPAQDGDFVTIDLSAVIEGTEIDSVKGISYEIGSGNMLEGMDDALIGLSVGESKTFTGPLAGGDREGEDAEITVVLGAVKERELPELDDDFAQEASEFDTLEELQADVAKQARQAKLFEQGVQARDKVLELLLETVEFEVPQGLIDAEVRAHLEGEGRLNDDEHRAEVRESSTRALRAQLLMDAMAEQAEVEVEQQELIEYLVMTAQQYGMEPGQFAQAMEQNNQIGAMVGEVARRKALAAVLEQVQVVDSNGTTVDLSVVIDDEDADDEETSTEEAPAAEAKATEAKDAGHDKA